MTFHPNYTFGLTDDQMVKYLRWNAEQMGIAVKQQQAGFEQSGEEPSEVVKQCWAEGYPYGGAAGGSNTYTFSHTNLGTVVKVTHAYTGETIDLSDYEDW